MRPAANHRVVITGMGAITPLGLCVEQFWQGLVEGRSAVDIATAYDTSDFEYILTAEVRNFDPRDFMDTKAARRMARFAQFAVAAAREALEDSGLKLEQIDRSMVGVNIGTGLGGASTTEEEARRFRERGRRTSAFYLPTYIANMCACQVAMNFDLHGPTNTPVCACATGTYSIGDAARMVQRGEALVMVAGGTDAGVTDLNAAAFGVIGALAKPGDDPKRSVKPFDLNRSGTAGGEGCGILILEQLEHALARGARIYAELAGFGATEDAFHLTAPAPDGRWAALAMQRALEDAGATPDEVGYVSAHGTGTPMNDEVETHVIKLALGEAAYKTPISAIKAMIGHTAGAAGALATIACVRAITDGIIPPTINYETPDPKCDLDYVPNQARRAHVDLALANAFGFGGQNAVIAVRRFEE